jgi:SPP1 gp7 family putative phage head morphogenesis protein
MKSKLMKLDPSRTSLLRRKLFRDMDKRFLQLKRDIIKLIVTEDAFGLKESPDKETLRKQGLTILQSFQFMADPQKIKAFQNWLTQQINAGVLKLGKGGKPWTNDYVFSAYKQGALRAYIDTYKQKKFNKSGWFKGSQEQFLLSFFGLPETKRRLELIFTRAYDQLQGISTPMGLLLSRHLATGLAHGWSPSKIAREINKSITTISTYRARMIARTEVIYAHAEGQLDSFENLGIDKLNLLVEWSTAGDELVCKECNANAGRTYTVDEARGLIPLHPNCRCAWTSTEAI